MSPQGISSDNKFNEMTELNQFREHIQKCLLLNTQNQIHKTINYEGKYTLSKKCVRHVSLLVK